MTSEDTDQSSLAAALSGRRVALFGVLLLADLVVTIVMLVTDKNLQTNFGSQSPYFSHWYGLLITGVLDLLVGASLLAAARMSSGPSRRVVIGALAWTVLAILAMVGALATYMQVGFTTPAEFGRYLFGVTPYPGALSYIPWLYDLLLAMYLLTAIVGALASRRR